MELQDEQKINATREQVFAALNDPEILRQCIPGCQSLDKTSDTEMNATVTMKVGPVKATFKGEVTLSDIVAPESYTITGKGKGGPAGFAEGSAAVDLREDEAGGTILAYKVKADVGGKIAQLGARLITSTARKLSAQFFEKFAELVEGQQAPTGEAAPQAAPESAPEETVAAPAPEAAPKAEPVEEVAPAPQAAPTTPVAEPAQASSASNKITVGLLVIALLALVWWLVA